MRKSNSKKLALKNARIDIVKQSFFYLVELILKSLPANVIEKKFWSIFHFMRSANHSRLKLYLLNICINFVSLNEILMMIIVG